MFILFGPAGSGKSLQGQILAEKYGWRWLSVGQLLRDQKNPALDKIMKEGGLVDDNFVVNMMHDAIKAAAGTKADRYGASYRDKEYRG